MTNEFKEYLEEIMSVLESQNFFKDMPISRSIMSKNIQSVMEYNLFSKGDFMLDQSDMITAYEAAVEEHVDEAIQDCLQRGLVEITGVSPEGDLVYSITPKGEEVIKPEPIGDPISAQFERIGPYGSYSLN